MISYKDSGVNIDEGNALVEGLKPLVKRTFDKNVIGGIGSFAGAWELPSGYKNPVILGATDGVGTKLRLAIDSGRLDSVGVDLVAMCVNDLICNFATPAFFLDYYATGKLDKNAALSVIGGIAKGCEIAQCALIGGETAEMPGMYHGTDFDLAGFAVGVAEKEDLQNLGANNADIKAGDVLIALPSSGLHSNGYSLARKVLFEKLNYTLDSEIDTESGRKNLADVLLEPTNIYVRIFKELKPKIKTLAHITGGGIVENLPRALPQGFGVEIDKAAIKTPEIFKILAKEVADSEMWRTFNMGVGMIFAVSSQNADSVIAQSGGYAIGEITQDAQIQMI